jgi:hypothetical protein
MENISRPGRIPGGYIRFVHNEQGLRRVLGASTQTLTPKGGAMDAPVYRRTIEVSPNIQTLLVGKQVSLAINFARAAMVALTAEKYVGDYYTFTFGQTGFTRLASDPLMENVRRNMMLELEGDKLPFPPVMWEHLKHYLLPLLPEVLEGLTGPGELFRLLAPTREKIEALLAMPSEINVEETGEIKLTPAGK